MIDIEQALGLVSDWLLRASSEVEESYFQLPVAGQEDLIYRERVYCYELYHRWRSHWPDGFPFSLCGELDKKRHPLIREGSKPDFLVHLPGEMTNLLIVEVKARTNDWAGMRDDLKKLTRFRRDLVPREAPGNYYAAFFWVYGLIVAEWPSFRETLLGGLEGSHEFDKSLMKCIIHEQPGRKAVEVPW